MNALRCYDHKDIAKLPPLCHTCQRINVEQKIVKKVCAALLNAGYRLRTDEQDDPRPEQPTKKLTTILNEMMAVDDEYLAVFLPIDKSNVAVLDRVLPMGWVRFVYGNDGWDVISDYTTNLEAIIDPICNWASKTYDK